MNVAASPRTVAAVLAGLLFCATTVLGSTPQERLRDFDADLNRTLHRIATADLATCEETRAAAEGFEANLRLLRTEAPELASKFDALAPLVGNLRRAAETLCSVRETRANGELQAMRALVSPLGLPGVDKSVIAQPGSDTCETAPLIAFGSYTGSMVGTTLDGSATCGGQGSGDVWYRISSPSYLSFLVDTLGSDFDSVLSLHSECPGTTSNQVSCSDDAVGLQSALESNIYASQSLWIRISSFEGIGGQYQLNYGTGGQISGTVTALADSTPLQDVEVRLYENGYFRGSTTTGVDGVYTIGPTFRLSPYGGFIVRTSSTGEYVDELYQDLPCVHSCDLNAGERVAVPAAGTLSGIDFALSAGARIEGTITDTAGQGLESVNVELFDAQGSFLHETLSSADGSYTFDKLPAGSFFIRARLSTYLDEIYDGVNCSNSPGCSVTDGTAVVLGTGQAATGIDVQLRLLGSISGTIVDQDDLPLVGVQVEFQRPNGTWVARTISDSQGRYHQRGLAPGEFLVEAREPGFLSQYYDAIECGFFGLETCSPSSATQVPVQLSVETTEIDFQLRNTGRISGTIRDLDNNPLAGIRVRLRTPPNILEESAYTDALGQYGFDDLRPGTYHIEAGGGGYLYEIYPDGQCSGLNGACNREDGTGIELPLAGHRSDIDLQLQQGGGLFGRVINGLGNPLYRWNVYAFDLETPGNYLAGAVTDLNGDYELSPLPAKPVYLLALRCSNCNYSTINEVYPNVHCPLNGSCPIADGMLITPQVGTSSGSFDFQIEASTLFSGRVYDAETGDGAKYTEIRLWDENGNLVDSTTTGGDAYYSLRSLGGKYTITASSAAYHGEVFDDISCPFNGNVPSCDVTTGVVFDVSTDQEVADVDFELEPRGVLAGRLISAVDGSGVSSRKMEVWDGQPSTLSQATAYTDADGYFRFTGLEGIYTLSSDPPSGNSIPTLYDGILCPLGVSNYYSFDCDPAKGTPIVVAPDQATTDVLMVEYPMQVGLYGYVKAAAWGDPLAGVQIDIWNAQDSTLVATVTTDASGHYYQALSTGTYLVSTRNSLGYAEQIYVGVDCPNGSALAGQCDPSQGYALNLAGTVPIRADFALTPRVLQMLKSDDFESGTLGGWNVVSTP